MNQTLLVILCTCGATLLVLGLLTGTWYVSNRRKERRILKFKASDFRDLGTVTRNSMAMKDLQALYRKVKYSVTYAANHGKFSTFVPVGTKLPHIYGAQFSQLILNPFIEKLTKEGFSHLPAERKHADGEAERGTGVRSIVEGCRGPGRQRRHGRTG